jgi:hypothetical protein
LSGVETGTGCRVDGQSSPKGGLDPQRECGCQGPGAGMRRAARVSLVQERLLVEQSRERLKPSSAGKTSHAATGSCWREVDERVLPRQVEPKQRSACRISRLFPCSKPPPARLEVIPQSEDWSGAATQLSRDSMPLLRLVLGALSATRVMLGPPVQSHPRWSGS